MATGRILIVDDERFFRDLLQEMLTAKGHSVRTAGSGEEAQRLLAAERFDVLVTDIVMPGMDGVALVREARARDPEIEAVGFTGHEDVRLAVAAMKAGCGDFLMKPVDREELSRAVDRALERTALRRENLALVSENVQYVKSQALYRQCLAILATLDLERLQDLLLSVLARITDAQGSAVWISDEKGQLELRAYRGVVDRAALPPAVDPKSGPLGQAIRAGTPFPAPGAAPGEAFYVPLTADDEPVGLALLTDRARGRFGPDEQGAALAVADFAGIAVRNARRFQAMERMGLRDRETSAYNLAYFVDYAGKEFYKARRYGRQFSLLVISVDNLEQMRKEAGRELFRCAGRDMVSAVSRVVRDADILAKVSENEYYVLLPETDTFGALMFLRRAAEEVRKEDSIRTLEQRCPVLLSMGAATFPKDGEDFDELLHWCRARAEEQRGSLLRRLHLQDLEPAAFWELCDILLAESAHIPESSPSSRRRSDPALFAAAQREAAREIGRDPRARGLLYLGLGGGLGRAPLLEALPSGDGTSRAGDNAVRVYVLGPRGAAPGRPVDHPFVTPVYLDGDKRMAAHEFMLFLGENAAYGLIQEPGGALFHTADAPLVDALVSKLQTLYDLQPI
jgi:diguanylate cyclase (GGDEF)-like protein